MSAWMERSYKVGSEAHKGVYLTVSPGGDDPDNNVVLYAESGRSAEYFGPIRIELEASMMRKLGEALIACSTDLEDMQR